MLEDLMCGENRLEEMARVRHTMLGPRRKEKESIMNMRSKAGFTLVELMVVAIIVAILAAVAIPLMSANRKRAHATEAQAGCSAVKTALRVMEAESLPFPVNLAAVKGFNVTDLDANYFVNTDYSLNGLAGSTNYSNYRINVLGSKPAVNGETLVMSNVLGVASWGGSLME
jgi:prepilin-type N-terminal cleavage/methylation domain-containing protein